MALAGVQAQEAASERAAAPEPYSYGYETESHAASEQKDPSGKVSGFYTIVDADGRSRRVEYFADETGFHAKVQTNEVGTKSESPADVEVLASPPTEGQLVYQAAQPQVQIQRQQQVVYQQPAVTTTTVQQQQQPARASYSVQQPAGYYPGYIYGNTAYGYGQGYGVVYGAGNYNNHLPSQYYRSVQTTSAVQPASVSRYVSTSSVQPVGGAIATQGAGNFRTYGTSTGYSAYGVPGAVGYSSTGPVTRTVSSSSSGPLLGSSNYIVLKAKRDSAAALKKEQ